MANEIVQVPDDGDVTVRAMVANVINAAWTEGIARAEEYDAKIEAATAGFLDMVNLTVIAANQIDEPTPVDATMFDVAATAVALPTDVDLSGNEATAGTSAAGTSAAATASTFSASLNSAISSMMEAVNAAAVAASSEVAVPESANAAAIDEPEVYIPYIADSNTLWDEWWDKTIELIDKMVAEGAKFALTYAPHEDEIYEELYAYLSSALANTDVGLSPAVAAQIWGNDQARLLSDKVRAQDAILAQFASRGFPLPTGAAASAVLQIEQKTQDELAASSRKIAEMSVELQKFNVEKLIDLRKIFLATLPAYINAIASAPDTASKMLAIVHDEQQKLITAAAAYYNARTNAAEAVNKVALANASLATDVSKTNASLGTDVSKTNASLETEVAKTNASLSSEANKTNASLSVDVSKTNASLGTEVSKANASLGVEVSKTNATLATDVAKANAALAFDASKTNASLETDVSKVNAGMYLDVAKININKDVDVGKTNATLELDAAKASANISADLTKLNMNALLDAAKFNVSESNKIAVENLKAEVGMIEQKLRALLEQAKTLGTLGTALLNNIHAGLGINANRNAQVGYSYSNDTNSSPPSVVDVG